jgi:hypothetical protein
MDDEIAGIPRKYVIVGGIVLAVVGYMWWRNRQAANSAAASQSNTASAYGQAIPGEGVIEPIILNGPNPTATATATTTSNPPTTTPTPATTPAGTPTLPGFIRINSPAAAKADLAKGLDVFSFNGTQYFNPGASSGSKGGPGVGLVYISSPAESRQLATRGYKIVDFAGKQWYNPSQPIGAK